MLKSVPTKSRVTLVLLRIGHLGKQQQQLVLYSKMMLLASNAVNHSSTSALEITVQASP
jgi:hypothetical protein